MRVRVIIVAFLMCVGMFAAALDLEQDFRTPPASARPWVYWFWLNGNITKTGITADLEAMQRVGVGGVLIMEVDQGAPVGPVDFMSAKWRELFAHVVAEAGRLGLEVNMNNDAGWNGSGGPWITPEHAMQKVVASEKTVEGPQRFDAALAAPETVAGYYRDIAVLAFPAVGAYRIENIRVKACYDVGEVGPPADKDLPKEMLIDRAGIIDLSAKLDKDGRLVWDAPAGKWTVLRFGHTCTGAQNAPSPATGRGLECDKLSKEGIEANFAGMMGKLIADAGPAAGKALAATHIDSWENGAQNWTSRMREEFKARRGYDLLPFLPVMTGRVVDSLEISERFLWDLRRTISELVVENYAGHLRTLAQRYGVRLSIEAYGGPCDNAPYAGRADEPMGEFWIGGGAFNTLKEMSSASHTYGKPITGAEAFTAADQERWQEHPASIKALGDRAFCDGINRFVFHRYALQPWADRRPGMTMGPWGIHYERTETWWESTGPWHTYLGRCQHLLRQGFFVADICHLQPEAAPQSARGHDRRGGYDYDVCSDEVVLTRMTVKDGRLTLPDGMSYRVLVLPDTRAMTPGLLAKIKELVEAGATVVGPRPMKSPSLSGYPGCDAQVTAFADALYGECNGTTITERRVGRGRIVWGLTPEQVLAKDGVAPDVTCQTRINWIHRAVGEKDFYFVANPRSQDVQAVCTFRQSGKLPEIWRPDVGTFEPAPVWTEKDGRTIVVLPLEASGSVFVVFRPGMMRPVSVTAVSRDGQELFSALQAAPKVVIRSAVYGVPGDAQRTRDVRAVLQARVDAGDREIPVRDMAIAGDPAPNVVKTLVVEYAIGDRVQRATGKDPEAVRIGDDLTPIAILSAVYGVLGDPARTRNVLDRVKRIAAAGERSFEVARLAQGDDPAFGIVKTVIIKYRIEGRELTATGTDPDIVYLTPYDAAERVVELARGDGGPGALQLTAWRAGRYEVTRADGAKHAIEIAAIPAAVAVTGPWQVEFPKGAGAPERITLDKLASLSLHPDAGVRFFSGTAKYTTTVRVPEGMQAPNRRLVLDLGNVRIMARVAVNGRDLGLLWKPPYRVEVTDALKTGDNALEVQVTNHWINRMIGDEELPDDSERNPDGTLKSWPAWVDGGGPSPTGRVTFTSWRLWRKGSPLQEAGLVGPVTVEAGEVRRVP